jgi:hypothetical protein
LIYGGTGQRSPLERLLVIAVPGQKENFALGAFGLQPAQPRFNAPDRQHGYGLFALEPIS